ncbi:RagB/SusD family nutrient uptake outer membrane protein [Limibacter armeniacum]|uniref:RagB/SusD family nutrient uptake outer membrane protein n=1 Tax=Limibacter armeniacum TaxID=466084 RepID=UPI002FE59AD3
MKKRYILPLVALLGMGTACEDFLDKEPLAKETSANFYNDPANAELAVNGIYDALQRDTDPFHHQFWMFGDVRSDDAVKGSSDSDLPELKAIENFEATNTNLIGLAAWEYGYRIVSRANSVLEGLDSSPAEESKKARLIGEAKFLRAFGYFHLVRIFGEVPVFTKTIAPSEYRTQTRASEQETFNQIIKDLTEAIELLPLNYDAANIGRATKGAAKAYLSRVLMYTMKLEANDNQENWQTVYNQTKDIINSGEYALLGNYAQLFEMEGENSVESIFEIQFVNQNSSGDFYGDKNDGTHSTIFQGIRPIDWSDQRYTGWGFNSPTQSLHDAFETNDPRQKSTIYEFGDGILLYGNDLEIFLSESGGTGFSNRKAQVAPEQKAPQSESPVNTRKMRYADVLLMHAEAAYNLGFEGEARDYVNMIRDRARRSTKPYGATLNGDLSYSSDVIGGALPALTNQSGIELRDAIWHERRVELGMEALRYFDIVRQRRARAVLNAYKDGLGDKWENQPFVPIPQQDEQWLGM